MREIGNHAKSDEPIIPLPSSAWYRHSRQVAKKGKQVSHLGVRITNSRNDAQPVFFAFTVLLAISFGLMGEARAVCEETLVRATYSNNSSVSTDWRLATLVSESAWNEASHNGGVNAVIYGVPVGASYGDYQKRTQSMLQSHNESYSTSTLTNIAWTGLDQNSTTVYEACVRNEAAKVPGLHLGVRAADASGVMLLVGWTQPGGGPIDATWTPRAIEGQRIPTRIPSGFVTIRVPRPITDITLAASFGGFTSEVAVLTPIPGPPPRIPPPEFSLEFG